MSNYRPLSLLSVPSKILESCVANMIAKHVFSKTKRSSLTTNGPTEKDDGQSYYSSTWLKLGDE